MTGSVPEKVIFLDIDGVLNSHRGNLFADEFIERAAVKAIDQLCQMTGAKIVVSSTWRLGRHNNCMHFAEMMRVMGFTGRIYYHEENWRTKSITEKGKRTLRGDEIKEWLSRHPEVTHYVIIDDDTDMLDEQLDNFVHVDYMEGFGARNYYRAAKILGEDIQDDYTRPFKPRDMSRGLKTYYEHNILGEPDAEVS